MNEEALTADRLFTEVLGPEIAVRIEVNIPRRGHRDLRRLERPPLAFHHANPPIIDRIAEDGSAKLDFTCGQRT